MEKNHWGLVSEQAFQTQIIAADFFFFFQFPSSVGPQVVDYHRWACLGTGLCFFSYWILIPFTVVQHSWTVSEAVGARVATLRCGWELSPAGRCGLALGMSEVGLSTSGFRLGGLVTCFFCTPFLCLVCLWKCSASNKYCLLCLNCIILLYSLSFF